MGWSTLYDVNTPEQFLQHIRTLSDTVLAAHIAFENGYSVLWTVEVISNGELGIICTLMRCGSNHILYKDMWEAVHPYYYSCPLHFLAMTEQWRCAVKAFHAAKMPKAFGG